MKKKFNLVLISACLLLSCKEEDPILTTTINGHISDYYTDSALTGIYVKIYSKYQDPSKQQFSYGEKYFGFYVDSLAVATDGTFAYTTTKFRGTSDYIIGFYNNKMITIDTNAIISGKNNEVDLKVKTYRDLKVNFKSNPETYDKIFLFFNEQFVEYKNGIAPELLDYPPYGYGIFMWHQLDTSLIIPIITDYNYDVNINFYKDNEQVKSKSQIVNYGLLDSLEYNVAYDD